MIPSEVEIAYEKIQGAWEDSSGLVFFVFSKWESEFGHRSYSLRIRINDYLTDKINYFLTINPLQKFIIHSEVSVLPFIDGKFILDLISDDTIEIKYNDTIYTLRRMQNDFAKIFEV